MLIAVCLYGLVHGTAEKDKHRRSSLGKPPMSNRFGSVKVEIDAHCVDNRRERIRTSVPSTSRIEKFSLRSHLCLHQPWKIISSIAGDVCYTWSAVKRRTLKIHPTCSIHLPWKSLPDDGFRNVLAAILLGTYNAKYVILRKYSPIGSFLRVMTLLVVAYQAFTLKFITSNIVEREQQNNFMVGAHRVAALGRMRATSLK